jgi:hypothetical protein
MRRITLSLLAALSLPLAPVSALAANGHQGPGASAPPLIRVDDDKKRDRDAERALAIVGALMGIALLERASREEERREPDPPRIERQPEGVTAMPDFPDIPVRPGWIESFAQSPRPAPAPAPATSIGDAAIEDFAAAPAQTAPSDDVADDVAEDDLVAAPAPAAPPPAALAPSAEPSLRIPPAPPAADASAPTGSNDVSEVFGRAVQDGQTGY